MSAPAPLVETERSLLFRCIAREDVFAATRAAEGERLFERAGHRVIWRAIADLRAQHPGGKDRSLEWSTLRDLVPAGHREDLNEISIATSANNAEALITTLRGAWFLREGREEKLRASAAAAELDAARAQRHLDRACELEAQAAALSTPVVPVELPDPFGLVFAPISEAGSDWFRNAPPDREWVLTADGLGFLPAGIVGLLVAAGGVGKTFWLLQLALAIATGRKFLDAYDVARPGYVLLALGEETAAEAQRRLYYAARALRLTDEEIDLAASRIVVLPLHGIPTALIDATHTATHNLELLRSRLLRSEVAWSLIVIDPLSRFAGIDTEKDNAAATRFVQQLETLTATAGSPAVIVAHHSPLNSRNGEGEVTGRGVTGITDACRWKASLAPCSGGAVLKIAKNSYGPQHEPLSLVRGEYGLLERSPSQTTQAERTAPGARLEPITELVLELVRANPGKSTNRLRALTGKNKGDVIEALGTLCERDLIRQVIVGNAHTYFIK